MKTALLALLFLSLNVFALTDTQRESQGHLRDAEIAKAGKVRDAMLSQNALQLFSQDQQSCDDDDDYEDAGEMCWRHCAKENYSTSYCKSSCGLKTKGAVRGCWNRCGEENYSTSYCISTCGTVGPTGEASCWARCGSENYSTSYCKSSCGIKTGAGRSACWKRCGDENYSTSYCKSTCG